MDSKNESDSQSTPPKKSKKHRQRSPKFQPPEDDSTEDLIIAEDTPTSTNKKRKKRDSATSSDEERWLTAIESGKLEDVDDELKKIKPKDPSLMTARQRAMYDRGTDGSPSISTPTLMSLPTGYKEKVMTAEAIQKAAIKSQKRKQLADEKREKDKKKTMERLLKKQESKTKITKPKLSKSTIPKILYIQNIDSSTITFPQDYEFPLQPKRIVYPSKVYCAMGCGNLKKYSCKFTNVPLCSFSCYKQNLARNKVLMKP
ncbi:INO80 complex subunit B isoform X2 [Photinus pyralis]|nr:INO80 complex subunit B isoform X2 [Photinus pyralis]